MPAPVCPTPMQPTGSIGARGYYCPAPECSVAAGPQYVLSYAPRGARGLVEDAVCGYKILISICPRCKLPVDYGDAEDKRYHSVPGGCQP